MPLYYPEDEDEDYVFVYDEDSLLKQKKTKKIPIENAQYKIFGGDFVITMSDSLTIKSKSKNKTFLTITEDEIIIGDVNAEHIRLKQ